MTRYKFLLNISPVLFPVFYTLKDNKNNELVFLDLGKRLPGVFNRTLDKTQYEALENHFHLFNKIDIKDKNDVIKIGSIISQNLIISLENHFPKKKFIVYLQVNVKESTVIRFHQQWNDEPPYFDLKKYKEGEGLFEFKTGTGRKLPKKGRKKK